MERQNGMIVDIKIQSISDIITNSSTEVFTIYTTRNKDDIKNLVNAILAINSKYTFDDLFTIHMEIDPYIADVIYDNYEEISTKFKDSDEFIKYLETLSDKDLRPYEQMIYELWEYSSRPLYSGIYIELKEGLTGSETLSKAITAINNIAFIFEHDYGEC